MTSHRALVVVALTLVVGAPVRAQQDDRGPGTLELTVIPAGALLVPAGDTESHFGNFDVGGALAVKINQYVGVEGESSVALGVYHQSLTLSGAPIKEAPPNFVEISGNVTVSAPGGTVHTVPYATGGLGTMILLTQTAVDVTSSKAFLTANAGGGLKWYARGRWGLRADYRLLMVRSSAFAPAFFGREGRLAHRVYAGVILTLVD